MGDDGETAANEHGANERDTGACVLSAALEAHLEDREKRVRSIVIYLSAKLLR